MENIYMLIIVTLHRSQVPQVTNGPVFLLVKCRAEKSITLQRIKNDGFLNLHAFTESGISLICLTVLKKRIPNTEKILFEVLF